MKRRTIYIGILFFILLVLIGCVPLIKGIYPGTVETQFSPRDSEGREPETIPGTVHGTMSPETEPPAESTAGETEGPIIEPDVTTEEYIYVPDSGSAAVKPDATRFVYVDSFLYQPFEDVKGVLEEVGLNWTVAEETYSDLHGKGVVLSAKHSGMAYGDKWILMEGDTVTLTLSLGKKPKPAADSKVCYLTFDDGPRASGTEEVIATLDRYGVKATFFLVGEFMTYYPAQVRALVNAGHVLGSHSMSHVYAEIYASGEAMKKDVTAWMDLYQSITGEAYTAGLYRFPGGSTCYQIKNNNNRGELLAALDELDFSAFDWTALNNDRAYGDKPADQPLDEYMKETLMQTVANVERGGKKPLIILVHETSPETRAQLGWMVEYLLDKGYTFDTLDNYNGNWLFG